MLTLWQELNLISEEEQEYVGDSTHYQKKVEKERVVEFLDGINRELDDIWEQVLRWQPLARVREIFTEIMRKENWRRVMLNKDVRGSGIGSLSSPGDGGSKYSTLTLAKWKNKVELRTGDKIGVFDFELTQNVCSNGSGNQIGLGWWKSKWAQSVPISKNEPLSRIWAQTLFK